MSDSSSTKWTDGSEKTGLGVDGVCASYRPGSEYWYDLACSRDAYPSIDV